MAEENKPKLGRPTDVEGEHKTHRLLVRYSPRERELLDKASRLSGMRITVMIRGESLKFAKEIIRLCENGKSPFPF